MISPTERMIAEIDGSIGWLTFNNPAKLNAMSADMWAAIEPIVDAQRKADLLKELAHKEGLRLEQTIAVGDGANDLPMLAIAGLGVAFRAKPLVKQSAKQAISTLGLDGVLYLLGLRDRDVQL